MKMRDLEQKLNEITATQPGVKIYTGDNITPQQITHNYDMVKQGKAKLDVSDHIGSFGQDAANALTFGYADNAAAALDSAFDKNKTYAGQMAKYKANAQGYGAAGPSVHVPDSIPLVGGGNITPGDLAGLFTGAGLITGGAKIGAKLLGKTVGKYVGGAAGLVAPAVGHAVIDPSEEITPTTPLISLQKVIGANPDGIYGPETKQKLAAWQKQNGLNPDGIPGPLTYTKMAQILSASTATTAKPVAESKKGNIMKKITESQLSDMTSKLREYIKLVEETPPANAVRDGSGNVVTSGSGAPVTSGGPAVPAASPLPAGMTQAQVDQARNAEEPGASPLPAGMTQAQVDQARNAAEPADNSGAPPAATTNFDSMSFGQAFKTAQAQGLKQFPWKGKQYAVKMANTPNANPQVAPGSGPFPSANASNTRASQDFPANPKTSVPPRPTTPLQAQVWDSKYAKGWNPNGTSKMKEAVSYTEDQALARIISLVNHR